MLWPTGGAQEAPSPWERGFSNRPTWGSVLPEITTHSRQKLPYGPGVPSASAGGTGGNGGERAPECWWADRMGISPSAHPFGCVYARTESTSAPAGVRGQCAPETSARLALIGATRHRVRFQRCILGRALVIDAAPSRALDEVLKHRVMPRRRTSTRLQRDHSRHGLDMHALVTLIPTLALKHIAKLYPR